MGNILEIVIKGRDVSGGSTLRNFRGEMDRAKTSSGGLKSSFGGLAGVLSGALKVGLAGGVAGIMALTGVIGGGVSKAMDLQQTVANTAAVMGKSAEDIKPLKTLIQDLAVDPMLKVSAGEAGSAINMLARNGLAMDQILQGAAKSTVLLANATDADFGVAADIATDTMALFNIKASEMSTAVNGITSVVNNSKFGIDDYRLALAQGGGVAATVGVQFDDFNTSIAAISPLFASGSDAGTSYKVMLQRLVPASGPAADAMKALGIITEDGSNKFFDASGNMRGMNEIAGVLQGALSGLSDAQKNQALSTIFGTDAMRAAAGMASVGKAGFEELQLTMGNTSAADAATTRMGTLSGQMDILWGIVEALQLKIGDAFIPVLQRLATQASAFLDTHGDRLVHVFEMMAVKVGELVVAIPPLITQSIDLYNRISEFVAPIASVVGSFVSWKDVLIAVGAVLTITAVPAVVAFVTAAAPIVALFAGIVAATAALRTAWGSDFLGMRTAITGFISDTDKLGSIKGMFANMGTSISNGFNDAKNNITLGGRTLTSGLKTVLTSDQFKAAAAIATGGLTIGINEVFDTLKPHVQAQAKDLLDKVKVGFSEGGLRGAAYAGLEGLRVGIGEKFTELSPIVTSKLKSLMDIFKRIFSWDALRNIGHLALDGLLVSFDDKWQAIKDKITGLGNMLPESLRSILDIRSPSKVMEKIRDDFLFPLENMDPSRVLNASAGIATSLTAPLQNFNAGAATSGAVTNNNSQSNNIFYVTVETTGGGQGVADELLSLASRFENGLVAA